MFSPILLIILFWPNGATPVTQTPTLSVTDTRPLDAGAYIPWRADRKLTWDDFQAAADAHEPLHAMTATTIAVKSNCRDNVLRFTVLSQFAPHESWTKNRASAELLQHEQMHFDLTEVYARRLRQQLSKLNGRCSDRPGFQKVVNRVFAEWKKEQNRYDAETRHGLDEAQQIRWTERIDSLLHTLEDYQAPATTETADL